MSKLTGEQRDMLKMYAHKQDAEGLYEFVEGLLDVKPAPAIVEVPAKKAKGKSEETT